MTGVGFFVILALLKQKPMPRINRFKGLFDDIDENSLKICHAQMKLMERQFVKLEKKRPEDAQALAQEYAEWFDEDVEDMGFMYMARLSELLN